jgi:hypothetical protein
MSETAPAAPAAPAAPEAAPAAPAAPGGIIRSSPAVTPEDLAAIGLADDGIATSTPLDYSLPGPPATPAGYNFEPPPHGVEVMPLAEQVKIREAFHAEGFDQGTAGMVAKLWNKACAKPPTAAELETGRLAGIAEIRRMWGDKAEANMAVVRAEIDRFALRYPGVYEMLEVSGLGNSVWLASTIFNRAQAR